MYALEIDYPVAIPDSSSSGYSIPKFVNAKVRRTRSSTYIDYFNNALIGTGSSAPGEITAFIEGGLFEAGDSVRIVIE
jgi:hypothetical protein